jgi:hypothetical protein
MSRRRDKLSFQHHAEVAPLPEPDQDLWLNRAERLGWSLSELRRQLRNARSNAAEERPASSATAGPPSLATAGPPSLATAGPASPATAEPQATQQASIVLTLRLCISPDKRKRWQAAADVRDQGLAEWLVSIADEAVEDSRNDSMGQFGVNSHNGKVEHVSNNSAQASMPPHSGDPQGAH